jgi:hypothetical protein
VWSVGSERWDVFVGEDVAGLAAPGDGAVTWTRCESAMRGFETSAAQLLQMRAEKGQKGAVRARLWLSGALARPFVLPAMEGVKRWQEAIQIAETLAPESTGLDGACTVWLDRWHAGTATLAVAASSELLRSVEEMAQVQGLQIATISPWWNAVLNAALMLPEPAGLLVIEDAESSTVLSGAQGAFVIAKTYQPRPDAGQRRAMLSRLALEADMAAPRAMVVWQASLDGTEPEQQDGQALPVVFGARQAQWT